MDFILKDATTCLQQGIDLLTKLDPEFYSRKQSICYNSTIGGHVRHNIDHFFSFIQGIPGGRIDYDSRQREEFIETNPEYASNKIQELIAQFEKLSAVDLDKSIHIKMDTGATHEESAIWSASSIRREIQFLISHTVHHYALIATICCNDGCKLPTNFGVAPSTLRYRETQDPQCAP